ncbi:hypothetical protein [Dactylosporangium salmoneum]|uniref:Uncharacterized protein n=1 Tax=Dactylosporangium salmoneum TaxID=53361 RepID=A0ABP5SW53_9ACTN
MAYAAHARMLRADRVAFVPFRDPSLALVTSLAVRDGDPDPVVRVLIGG